MKLKISKKLLESIVKQRAFPVSGPRMGLRRRGPKRGPSKQSMYGKKVARGLQPGKRVMFNAKISTYDNGDEFLQSIGIQGVQLGYLMPWIRQNLNLLMLNNGRGSPVMAKISVARLTPLPKKPQITDKE